MNWKQLQGQTIAGEFQLREYLGGDDRSATYLASAPGNDKIAVKLVAAGGPGTQPLPARWELAGTLSHPNLLRVLRSGSTELSGSEVLYLVTEYAEENLSQVLPQRALTADEVREMLPPVLAALDYLHGLGLVHAHLKPANIMAVADQLKLSVDGVVKVNESLTANDPYTAPEAVNGATSASDIWSLGVTLTEVLTQKRPMWDAGSALPDLPAQLPDQFRLIVQRCLMQDPALRATTAFIRERLQATSPAPPPPQPSLAPAKRSRSPKVFLIPAVAVVAIVAVIAITHREAPPQPQNSEVTEPAKATAPPVQSPPPAVLTEATDPRPAPEKPSAVKPQRLEVLMEPVLPANAPPPPRSAKDDAAILKPPPRRSADSADVVHQVLPDVPRKALDTINGKFRVQVKVQVDRQGNVVASEFLSRGPSRYFADLTMQAAKEWKFSPAEQSERAWNLEFEFRRSGPSVTPMPLDR